ncbi:TorF family putative porin [Marinimicrobium locisalis]|uniref:TorF family putative porin n=1 Tax=Marinimicrobium locisalis TaxID=546022 RepID=UPI003221F3F2
MKMKQSILAGAVAVSAMASAALAPVANAEVSASVGAANMYYWRGYDLGNGDPAIWGDINVSGNGAYAGMWASSGDASAGTEYDLYVGYGSSVGDFSYDFSLWTYAYPSTKETTADLDTGSLVQESTPTSPGDLVEFITGLGYGPVSVTYYHGLEDLDEYWYATVGLSAGDFAFTYGLHEDDYAHFDIGYAYNDNLSFTLGLVADDADFGVSDEAKFVVGFSIPIE